MITQIARTIADAFGFGSVLCINHDANALASELRRSGMVAFDNVVGGIEFDYIVADISSQDEERTLSAKRGLVLLAPAKDHLPIKISDFFDKGFCVHPRSWVFESLNFVCDYRFFVLKPNARNREFENIPLNISLGSLIAEIGKLATMRDRVLVLGDHSAYVEYIAAANLLTSDITVTTSPEPEPSCSFDLILLTQMTDLEDMTVDSIQILGRLLRPGGRLALITYEASARPLRSQEWLAPLLQDCVVPESLFVPNGAPELLRETTWMRYSLSDQSYWANGWQAIILMKLQYDSRPEYIEKSYCNSPLGTETTQYSDQRLLRSMISVQTRLQDGPQLERLAEEVLQSTNQRSDLAAAWCVKMYILLARDVPWDAVERQIEKLEHLFDADINSSPVDIRWAVSLSYVRGLLEQKYGVIRAARESFERCARYPFSVSSPMLATKTISACQHLAFQCLADGDIEKARYWFLTGRNQALEAIRDERLSIEGTLPLFVLPELSQVLGLGAQCNAAMIAIDEGLVSQIRDISKCDIISQIEAERFISVELRRRLVATLRST